MAASTGVRPSRAEALTAFLYRPEVRQAVYQVLLLAAVGYAVYWVVNNVADNLRRQNIASGFEFLGRTSGFDVSQTLIDYSSTSSYGRAFWVGLLNTLLVAGARHRRGDGDRLHHRHRAALVQLAGRPPGRAPMSRSCATCRCCCNCSSGTSPF